MLSRLRWDYLRPSPWNMTEKVAGRLDAFQWIREHGTTLKQVELLIQSLKIKLVYMICKSLSTNPLGFTLDPKFANLDELRAAIDSPRIRRVLTKLTNPKSSVYVLLSVFNCEG